MANKHEKTLLNSLIFFGILWVSPALWSADKVDFEGKCFAGYLSQNSQKISQDYLIWDCIQVVLDQDDAVGAGVNAFVSRKDEIADLAHGKKDLSRKAVEVYYNDKFCGRSPSVPLKNSQHTSCDDVFRFLAQLDPSGMYQYPCLNSDGTHCKDFGPAIVAKLSAPLECDKDNAHKNHCHEVVRDFLKSEVCSSKSSTDACGTQVAKQVPGDICKMGNYDKTLCIESAEAKKDSNDTKKSSVTDSTGDGGDAGPDNIDPQSTPEQDFKDIAEKAAQKTFGGAGMGEFDAASAQGNVRTEGVVVEGPNADYGSGDSTNGPVSLNPGAASGLGVEAQLGATNRGYPGGTAKKGSRAGGGGGGGGGAVGGVAGGGGGGGAKNSASRGGRRRGPSRFKDIQDGFNGFMSTDGAAGGGGNAGPQVVTEVDQKVRDQIKRNKAAAINKAVLQKAFDANFNGQDPRRPTQNNVDLIRIQHMVYDDLIDNNDTIYEHEL